MAYDKYRSSDPELYETVEPAAAGTRTKTFTNPPDGFWFAVEIGASQRGSFQWSFPDTIECTIDGVDMELKNKQIYPIKAKEISVAAGLVNVAWFRIIGLNNK